MWKIPLNCLFSFLPYVFSIEFGDNQNKAGPLSWEIFYQSDADVGYMLVFPPTAYFTSSGKDDSSAEFVSSNMTELFKQLVLRSTLEI